MAAILPPHPTIDINMYIYIYIRCIHHMKTEKVRIIVVMNQLTYLGGLFLKGSMIAFSGRAFLCKIEIPEILATGPQLEGAISQGPGFLLPTSCHLLTPVFIPFLSLVKSLSGTLMTKRNQSASNKAPGL